MSSMHETPDPTPAGSPPPPAPPPALPPAAGPRRFLRSREDRLIGGVAGGLGRTFGIDPVLFRIVFVALLFVGGVGVPLYLLTLLVTPSDAAGLAKQLKAAGATQVWLATSDDDAARVTGTYLKRFAVLDANPQASDVALQEELLTRLADLTGVVLPR